MCQGIPPTRLPHPGTHHTHHASLPCTEIPRSLTAQSDDEGAELVHSQSVSRNTGGTPLAAHSFGRTGNGYEEASGDEEEASVHNQLLRSGRGTPWGAVTTELHGRGSEEALYGPREVQVEHRPAASRHTSGTPWGAVTTKLHGRGSEEASDNRGEAQVPYKQPGSWHTSSMPQAENSAMLPDTESWNGHTAGISQRINGEACRARLSTQQSWCFSPLQHNTRTPWKADSTRGIQVSSVAAADGYTTRAPPKRYLRQQGQVIQRPEERLSRYAPQSERMEFGIDCADEPLNKAIRTLYICSPRSSPPPPQGSLRGSYQFRLPGASESTWSSRQSPERSDDSNSSLEIFVLKNDGSRADNNAANSPLAQAPHPLASRDLEVRTMSASCSSKHSGREEGLLGYPGDTPTRSSLAIRPGIPQCHSRSITSAEKRKGGSDKSRFGVASAIIGTANRQEVMHMRDEDPVRRGWVRRQTDSYSKGPYFPCVVGDDRLPMDEVEIWMEAFPPLSPHAEPSARLSGAQNDPKRVACDSLQQLRSRVLGTRFGSPISCRP